MASGRGTPASAAVIPTQARLVLGQERPHESSALHGDVIVRGHEVDPVELVGLADDHEPAHEVAQQAEPGVLLAGQPRAPRGEGLARVLQEQPLERDHLHAGDRAAASVGPELDEELPGSILREDAQGVAEPLARVELHLQGAEPAGTKLRQDARPLEEKLDPVAGEVAEEARGTGGPREEPHEVLLAQRESQPVVDRLRRAQVAPQAAEAPQGEHVLLGGLDDGSRGQPKDVPRAVTPGVVAVAAGEDHHGRAGVAFGTRQRRHEAVALEDPRRAQAPVADGIVLRAIGAGQVHDEPRLHRLEDGRQRLPERGEEAGVAHARAERDRGRCDGLGVSPVVVVDREGVDGGVVGEDAARPVAVVQIEVHHEHGLREASRPQAADGDRHVVEDAEPEPRVGHRVVEAAPEVHGDPPGPQREAGRLDGAADDQPQQVERRLHLGRGHLDAEDPAEPFWLLDGVQVLGSVDAEQVLQRGGAGLGEELTPEEPGLPQRAQDPIAPKRVDRHAEDAPLVAPVVDDRNPPRSQAVERAAGDPGEGAKGTKTHRPHCTVAARRGMAGLELDHNSGA